MKLILKSIISSKIKVSSNLPHFVLYIATNIPHGLETFSNGAIFVIYDYFPVLFVERASFKSSDRDGSDKGHFFSLPLYTLALCSYPCFWKKQWLRKLRQNIKQPLIKTTFMEDVYNRLQRNFLLSYTQLFFHIM